MKHTEAAGRSALAHPGVKMFVELGSRIAVET